MIRREATSLIRATVALSATGVTVTSVNQQITTIPARGEKVTLHYRAAGRARARVRDAASIAAEAALDDVVGNAERLEDLPALVGLQRRDAHLGHDLAQALAYRLDENLPDNPDELKTEELEKELVFAGLIGMIDPARTEVKPALEHARHAGIRTVMITGDNRKTAEAIASQIGIDRVLARLDGKLAQTLAVVISKSGGTKETRNAMLEELTGLQRTITGEVLNVNGGAVLVG